MEEGRAALESASGVISVFPRTLRKSHNDAAPMGSRTSASRRLGLRAENHASGACLALAASARVSRTPFR
jgi:hypothetical protein